MGPQPFDARFETPAGRFDASHVLATAVGFECDPPYWELNFYSTKAGSEVRVMLNVMLPRYTGVEVTGTRPAVAQYVSSQPLVFHTTYDATFEATRIDYPGDGAPRMTGHVLVTDPAWTMDFDLDVLGWSMWCL